MLRPSMDLWNLPYYQLSYQPNTFRIFVDSRVLAGCTAGQMKCRDEVLFACLDGIINNLVQVLSTDQWQPLEGVWTTWVSRYFNGAADKLAGTAAQLAQSEWGWLRMGPLPERAQILAWSDGSCGRAEGHGWLIASRGGEGDGITLEGVGGGSTQARESMHSEALGLLGLSEGLKRRVLQMGTPAGWGQCPQQVWTEAYASLLHQLRRPRAGPYSISNTLNIESLYEVAWNN